MVVEINVLFMYVLYHCDLQFRTKRVGLEQSGPHHHLIENELVLATIKPKNC
jgi:hypothetical protein